MGFGTRPLAGIGRGDLGHNRCDTWIRCKGAEAAAAGNWSSEAGAGTDRVHCLRQGLGICLRGSNLQANKYEY